MTAWQAPVGVNGAVPPPAPIVRDGQPAVLGHERDTGMMPWWAWASIGAVVVFCGMLVIAAVDGQHSTGGESFDPHTHVGYSDMTIVSPGGLFEGTADFVTWTVDVEGTAWDAGAQADESTSMPTPNSGMKYVGIDLAVESTDNATLVEDAFLFSYITPSGQEYTQHYCGTGCLSSAGIADYEYDGWLYFEVPKDVPEGGYLRVNLIRSTAYDTLMELP
ncbi:DUF4352 domain-containing protein [Flaviflexus equikiangi]|uniref:DUF4352 domain-containing protein n=1 Tax=Flaviflexus equikiangi TaxID=2758573 RepID=A0ABS2TBU5_9ACTO|nr:hypothetical protein [Flaviflexus equikiangi]MBM9432124.1 hypothetical protein [Flaviflexus equikiangi]